MIYKDNNKIFLITSSKSSLSGIPGHVLFEDRETARSMIFVMVESHIQHLRLDVVFLAKASNA